MAHVIGTKMLVRDYNRFGVLNLKTGETDWMEVVHVRNGPGDAQREFRLNGVQDSSPTKVFEELARAEIKG